MAEEREKRQYNEKDLVQIADWAEEQERVTVNVEWKRAFGAIRQGADWLLRRMAAARGDSKE